MDPWGPRQFARGSAKASQEKVRKRSATWLQGYKDETCSSFPVLFKKSATLYPLADFLTVNKTSTEVTATLVRTVLNHIQQLSHYFHEYFGNDDTSLFDWIWNPFESQLTDLTGREQEELAELSSDRTLHLQFNQMSLMSFWIACSQKYPLLSDKAVNVLFLPPCAKQHILQSLRWKPNTDRDWTLKMTWVCLSKIPPRLDKLCSEKQAHHSQWILNCKDTADNYQWLIEIVTISICAMINYVMYMHELLTSWIWGLWGSAIWQGHVLGVGSMKKFETSGLVAAQWHIQMGIL